MDMLKLIKNFFRILKIRKRIIYLHQNGGGRFGKNDLNGYQLREYRGLQTEHTKLTGGRYRLKILRNGNINQLPV